MRNLRIPHPLPPPIYKGMFGCGAAALLVEIAPWQAATRGTLAREADAKLLPSHGLGLRLQPRVFLNDPIKGADHHENI